MASSCRPAWAFNGSMGVRSPPQSQALSRTSWRRLPSDSGRCRAPAARASELDNMGLGLRLVCKRSMRLVASVTPTENRPDSMNAGADRQGDPPATHRAFSPKSGCCPTRAETIDHARPAAPLPVPIPRQSDRPVSTRPSWRRALSRAALQFRPWATAHSPRFRAYQTPHT